MEEKTTDELVGEIKPSTARKGLVAYFDILGYQRIIDNNKIEEVINIITNDIEPLKKDVENELKNKIEFQFTKKALNMHEWLIFSDTILLCVQTEDITAFKEKISRAFVFFLLCKQILVKMFESGLPLRGAISYGEYFISMESPNMKCFAGKPIIDAYRLSKRLALSGCVLKEEAMDFLVNLKVNKPDIEDISLEILSYFVIKYTVPFNDDKAERYNVLKWMPSRFSNNIRETVLKSFLDHNKDVGPNVMSKVNNTEIFFQYLKTLNLKKLKSKPSL